MSTSCDVVVIIVNVNAAAWIALQNAEPASTGSSEISNNSSLNQRRIPAVKFAPCWAAVLTLLSALAVGWNKVKVALVVVNSTDSLMLWQSHQGELHPDPKLLTATLTEFIASDFYPVAGVTMLPLGFAQALCLINARRMQILNRFSVAGTQVRKNVVQEHSGALSSVAPSRIVLIDAGNSGHSSQYSALLNLAFAAQKKNVMIDVCSVGGQPAMTGGFSLSFVGCLLEQIKEDRARRSSPLLEYLQSSSGATALGRMFETFLLFHFSPCGSRDLLPVARQSATLNSSVCKCHKKVVEIAAICSCCLTIFCQDFKEPICSVCRTRFKRDRQLTMATAKLSAPATDARSSNQISGPSAGMILSNTSSPS